MRILTSGIIASAILGSACALAGDAPEQRIELGRVQWHRGVDDSLSAAKDKPAFVLFQEVPG